MTVKQDAPDSGTQKDPVCGMTVEPSAERTFDYRDKTYYFCSDKCLAKFKNNPELYLNEDNKQQTETSPTGEYTCPMHPEVSQEGPGECPVCGMALEPVVPERWKYMDWL